MTRVTGRLVALPRTQTGIARDAGPPVTRWRRACRSGVMLRMTNYSSVPIGSPMSSQPQSAGSTPGRSPQNSLSGPAVVRLREHPKDPPTPVALSPAQAEAALATAEAIGSLFPQPLDVYERAEITPAPQG